MSGLRIAIIADSRHPVAEPFAGGLESHVWHLTTALRRRGHEVSLFAGPGSDPRLATRLLTAARVRLSAAARRDPSMPEQTWMHDHHAYLELMLRLGGELADSFDVIHNHSLHYLPVAMASMVRTPMVMTLHTPPTPWLESAIRAAETSAIRFVAVSQYTADAWSAVTPDVPVIRNGVPRAHWPAGKGGRELIWFGRLTEEKAPHLAISAAVQAGGALRIAGPVHDQAYFERFVEPLLGGQVSYLGHLPQAALALEVGRSAATLVTPMWDEPYGLVVAESLSCGTPVAAFARGGIPEIITSDCGEVVAGGDVKALAAAAHRVVRLSRASAVRRATDFCSIERMVDSYLETYKESLAVPA